MVLMCSWLTFLKLGSGHGWSVLDIFCGTANISKLVSKLGFRTASVDIKMDKTHGERKSRKFGKRLRKGRAFTGPKRNMMDINGHVGFPFLSHYFWLCTCWLYFSLMVMLDLMVPLFLLWENRFS